VCKKPIFMLGKGPPIGEPLAFYTRCYACKKPIFAE
jgi:hypothetical protein